MLHSCVTDDSFVNAA